MDKIKYIITDPCYLMTNKLWSKCCENISDLSMRIAEILTINTGSIAYVSETGYGDWSNQLKGNCIQDRFFADTGMVCVCKLTPEIEKICKSHGCAFKNGSAIIETEGNVNVVFDTSNPEWTVIHINDDKEKWSSLEYDDDEFFS